MNTLKQGQQLNVGDHLDSTNGRLKLIMQGDGNLVLYRTIDGVHLWASNTLQLPAATRASMQSDGNFVMYSATGTAYWATGTNGHPGSRIVLQDDGNIVVYDPANKPLWASNTVQNWMTKSYPVSFTDANGVTLSNRIEFMDAGAGADPALPLVILLHGVKGNAGNMTNPDNNNGNKVAVPAIVDRGWNWYPNFGVWGFEVDSRIPVTSWRTALNTAGFPTLVYSQIDPEGFLARPTQELNAIMDQVVLKNFARRKLAFVGHSRGGLLLRNFLVSRKGDPNLLNRIVAAVTLHSSHQGTDLANLAQAVIAALNKLISTLSSMPGVGDVQQEFAPVLNWIRSQIDYPAVQELAAGSSFLTALAANEPVPGIQYHTFGGTSTRWIRVRSNVFTLESAIPQWHSPPFHWSTSPLQLISLIDDFTSLTVVMPELSKLAPELLSGSGDTLVADARAHLAFSASKHTNTLNHAEALFDPALQKQGINILRAAVGKPPLP